MGRDVKLCYVTTGPYFIRHCVYFITITFAFSFFTELFFPEVFRKTGKGVVIVLDNHFVNLKLKGLQPHTPFPVIMGMNWNQI